ncbi:MAG: ADP-ribosylglycohydrolase family protein [Verrucomicrobia bacterium]|nr:ADP-ribosylglycohydrolase family protein [Verrucomicrobiota bacterium]
MTLPLFPDAPARTQFTTWANRSIWLYGCDLATEWTQAQEEGRDLSSVEAEFRRLMAVEPAAGYLEKLISGKRDLAWFEEAVALIDRVQTLPMRKDYPHVEPDDLKSIRAERERGPAVPKWKGTKAALADRVRGAFLGRVAGCMLGKPFECVDRGTIRTYAEETGNWPLKTFQREPTAAELKRILKRQPRRPILGWQAGFYINRCAGFPSDDDINYTVMGMEVMRRHGADFSPLDLAWLWTNQLPLLATCTAERVAYRNFIEGLLPPYSATHRNPYREWIGAQIRADFFGYAAPGDPTRGAEWAWRDASMTHVKNGIYGEMWVAAMLAAAYTLTDWPAIIRAGLAQVPRRSRFHAGVTRILDAHAGGATPEAIIDSIHAEWDEFKSHAWCHTTSNAQVVAMALLGGEDDYSKTIALAVAAGFDTDCNGATAGSLWGLRHGEKALPKKWLRPLKNRLRTGLFDYADLPLNTMADKMVEVVEQVNAKK